MYDPIPSYPSLNVSHLSIPKTPLSHVAHLTLAIHLQSIYTIASPSSFPSLTPPLLLAQPSLILDSNSQNNQRSNHTQPHHTSLNPPPSFPRILRRARTRIRRRSPTRYTRTRHWRCCRCINRSSYSNISSIPIPSLLPSILPSPFPSTVS